MTRRSVLRAVATAGLLAACAQASSPPGAPRDKQAPIVTTTVPAQGAIVPNFRGPVRIRFDKTLSERGARLADVVVVSPEAGEVDVHRGGHELRINIKGGWQSGRVYHVTVLPGLQDRIGNVRNNSYELVFSTGPQIVPTVLGGIVTDRLTGRPVQNARVVARSVKDSVSYTTLTDTAGFYALRSLPLATYRVIAFLDQNRNRKVDGLEARDERALTITTPADTMINEFSVLALDTTKARLLRAEARDSQQLRLSFDDFMDVNVPLDAVTVALFQLPDSTPVGGVLMTPREFERHQRESQPKDTTKARAAAPTALRGPGPDTTKALPSQELVWVPSPPLRPRTRYRVTVQGVKNITGISSGGGSVVFETPARFRTGPQDTTGARPARRDSTKVAPAKRDTSRITPPRRDTLKAVPAKHDTSNAH